MGQLNRLEGKRALVTGGGRGIGAAIVRRLAAEGAAVAVNYVSNAASAEALVRELRDAGHQASAFQADVGDPAQTRELVQKVVAEFGGLDLLASNAGVEHFGALDSITQADFDRVFQINVAGQLFATQAAVAAMSEGGRITLTASISARISVYQHTLYGAAKAAVSAMARNLAPELAERGIAINAIAPGGTHTDMAATATDSYIHPALREQDREAVLKSKNALGRWADPREIAAAVAFLLSPDASYITGSTLEAAGGWM
ncbi:dehydrogenase [Mycobacterium sp. 852002-51163_SCH5372311]|uniref:SDR family NAD(P)-dependent oxidoreductase n=1 Tax=Mycobacterium sp. 852002-51163_SCH5372311 TaxID=1834097 RepID=UPI0007FF1B6E|nr:SDR family oxidoreductase [Mycobacterium sp. 852002-51163_SCH5372311]OBF86127.1 dehydrogenase [Mycobacterium sp. 852002-51163_SCH5372311]